MELPRREEYHKNAIRLNTGRNCLEYILRCRKYSKVYIPYYTCDSILDPFNKLEIPYEFYHIDIQLEITDDFTLQGSEALLYTNYFGLKQRYVEQLAEKVLTHSIHAGNFLECLMELIFIQGRYWMRILNKMNPTTEWLIC